MTIKQKNIQPHQTSGETILAQKYGESATYSSTNISNETTSIDVVATYVARDSLVSAFTPSSRHQDEILNINERLNILTK